MCEYVCFIHSCFRVCECVHVSVCVCVCIPESPRVSSQRVCVRVVMRLQALERGAWRGGGAFQDVLTGRANQRARRGQSVSCQGPTSPRPAALCVGRGLSEGNYLGTHTHTHEQLIYPATCVLTRTHTPDVRVVTHSADSPTSDVLWILMISARSKFPAIIATYTHACTHTHTERSCMS